MCTQTRPCKASSCNVHTYTHTHRKMRYFPNLERKRPSSHLSASWDMHSYDEPIKKAGWSKGHTEVQKSHHRMGSLASSVKRLHTQAARQRSCSSRYEKIFRTTSSGSLTWRYCSAGAAVKGKSEYSITYSIQAMTHPNNL